MPLNLDLAGQRTEPESFTYDWRDAVRYALGVGATTAENLDVLYERRGPRVLPTFGVIPPFTTMGGLVGRLGHNPAMLLHGEQELRCAAPMPASATLSTTGVVRAIYDKGKGALVVIDTSTETDAGDVVAENTYSLYIRGEGGFGGERGPKAEAPVKPDGAPSFEVSETTSLEQAALYRLSGDTNPIHIDPEVATAGKLAAPILHGLCTFGYAGRVALGQACGGDPARFRGLRARFVGVVYPGDTLTFCGWHLDGGRVLLEVDADNPTAGSRPVLAGLCEVA